MRASISRLRFWWPRSMRLTALWLVPSASASCGLGPAAVLAGVADEVADPAEVVVGHAARLYLRYEIRPNRRRRGVPYRRSRRRGRGQRG